jgi:acid phosphatase
MKRFALAALTILTLAGCAAMPEGPPSDKVTELRNYRYSGAYRRDADKATGAAEKYILTAARQEKKPAIVLDIDETSLSNWPEYNANGMVFKMSGPCDNLPNGPCGLDAWQLQAKAHAVMQTLALYNAARGAGVDVFFVTERGEGLRKATERNLHRAGYDRGWKELIMRPRGQDARSIADYKTAQRRRIESMGYTIVANIGDQDSDLRGGHAMRSFRLPNPFYEIP